MRSIIVSFVKSGTVDEASSTPTMGLLKGLGGGPFNSILAVGVDPARNLAHVLKSMSGSTKDVLYIETSPSRASDVRLYGDELNTDTWTLIWDEILQDATNASGVAHALIVFDDSKVLLGMARAAFRGDLVGIRADQTLPPYTAISITVDITVNSDGVATGEPIPVGWTPTG